MRFITLFKVHNPGGTLALAVSEHGRSTNNVLTRLTRKNTGQFEAKIKRCPVCAMPLTESESEFESVSHNPETCRLVNIALSELGVKIEHTIRINIYPGAGPLRGFYFTADPYTIHVSEEAYRKLREYIIFHETKHLVDCLQFGRSEEVTPDSFARSLCAKYQYSCPPEGLTLPWSAYA